MNPELELVVRRDHAILTPSYHVTVAETNPMHVVESFDLQSHAGLWATAQAAVERLRTKGYRLTAPIEMHQVYVTGSVARDGQGVPTVVLAGDLVQDARQIMKALAAVETRSGAEDVVRLVNDLMANALAIKAKADAVLSSDSQVEAAAVYDDVVTVVDGGAL